MISFKGDAHKFYNKLKKTLEKDQSLDQLKEMDELNRMKQFYQQLDASQLNNIRYRMMKEQNGTGMVPILVSSLPWLVFIFSEKLQRWLFDTGRYLWIVFIIIYSSLIILGVVIHYREKAWAAVHVAMIEDILEKREKHEKT